MKMRLSFALLCGLLMLGMVACEKAGEDPTPTPDQESVQAAGTLFAQPTRSTLPTPTITPISQVELELSRSVARMEQAVLAGDYDTYMSYVSQDDPVFWQDHAYWAQDWDTHPLGVFNIELFNIQSNSPDTAQARMTILWRQGDISGGSTVTMTFKRQGDRWLLAGELWKTADTPGIRFYYFSHDALDNQSQADHVIEYLPSIYARLTREFDFVPQATAHIKMYETPVMLHNWTRISKPTLDVWNEPGESIKITLGPSDLPPHESEIAREYTRFLLFEMGGSQHGDYPWWFETGMAEYGSYMFQTFSRRNRMLKQIAALTFAGENDELQLCDWSDLESEPDFFPDAQAMAIGQTFTLFDYITETFGTEARNTWIKAIVDGETVAEATQAHLGVNFEEVDAGWRAWLPQQL